MELGLRLAAGFSCKKISSRRSPRLIKWQRAPAYWTRNGRAL